MVRFLSRSLVVAACCVSGQAAMFTIQQPISISYPQDPLGNGGTLTNPANASDGDWNTYAQTQSDGNGTYAIVWKLQETWAIPAGASDLKVHWKIATNGAGQYDIPLNAIDPVTSQPVTIFEHWNWSNGHNEFTGILDEYVPIQSTYVDSNGHLTTQAILFNKWDSNSWSRLYEVEITGTIPEPITVSLFALAGLVLTPRTRRKPG